MRFKMCVGYVLAVTVIGCGGPPLAPHTPVGGVNNDPNRVVSVLDTPFVLAPNVVNAGHAFDVTIWATIGGCNDDAGTDVVADSEAATLTPYNLVTTGDTAAMCPMWVRTATRVARVMFTRVGTDTITLRGYVDSPSARPGLDSIVRTVVVAP